MLEWKNINGTRHVYLKGESACGAVGLEQGDEAPPCQICLGSILEISATAYQDADE